MDPSLLLLIYCVLIVAASILGGWLPIAIKLTHTRLQVTTSVIAGFMLGVAMLHMIPHAAVGLPLDQIMMATLAGLVLMFLVERFFTFHHHEVAELDDAGKVVTPSEDLGDHSPEEHHAHHGHTHAHAVADHTPGRALSWVGAAIGMSVHSILGGIALASATLAASHDELGHAAALPGLAVFLVTILHKPLDAVTVITLTASAGYSKKTRHLINLGFALALPVGVALSVLAFSGFGAGADARVVALALAFSAGTFLCIALSDLLPELHFHSHDRLKLSLALIVGLVLSVAVGIAEHATHDHSGHSHGHDETGHDDHSSHEHLHDDHDHGGHDHDHRVDPHAGHDHQDHDH
jgi:zinc and cadmium transporter